MELFLARRHVLQISQMSVSLVVGLLKTLIKRQEHLESGLIWEVDKPLLEFYEVLHTGQMGAHTLQRLRNCGIHLKELAILALGGLAAHGSLWSVLDSMAGLLHHVKMLGDARTTKGQLVSHAIGVKHGLMLVAIRHTAFSHKVHH